MGNRANDKQQAIRNFEDAVNVALLVWGDDDPEVRKALLLARAAVRTALGEAIT